MHTITIAFGAGMWPLMFKTEEAAQAVWMKINDVSNLILDVTDDFGQHCVIKPSAINGAMIEDLALSQLAHAELALHRARTQAKANSMANADPMLRQAAMGSGPAILSPMGNGRFNG